MGTVLTRLVMLVVVWTTLSAGITWLLTVYGNLNDRVTPFVVLVAADTAHAGRHRGPCRGQAMGSDA